MNIQLIYPMNEEKVSTLAAQHKAFLQDGGFAGFVNQVDYQNLMKTGVEDSWGAPVQFLFDVCGEIPENVQFEIELSTDEAFTNVCRYPCGTKGGEVYNLLIGTRYFWRVHVCAENQTVLLSQTACFITENIAPRMIKAEGISNVRDLGGWKTEDNRRIRQGLLYRGSEFDSHQSLSHEAKNFFLNELKIKTDLDLRAEAVGRLSSSPLDESVNYALIPVAPYHYMEDTKEGYLKVFKLLAKKENYPIYFHCWGGCDRTGTIAFMILALLGVSQEDIFMDYDFTSFSVWGPRSSKSGDFVNFLHYIAKWGNETDSIKTQCENLLYDIGVTKEKIAAICDIMLSSQ